MTTKDKRASLRYRPDPGTVAYISFDESMPTEKLLTSLVLEESYKGCGLVALHDPRLVPGAKFFIKVGKLDVLPAELRWRSDLDQAVMRAGIMYLR